MVHLQSTVENGVAHLVLDNPPQNRIGDQMIDDLASAIRVIKTGDARAVLVSANGPDFSLGGDLMPWADRSADELRGVFERFMDVYNEFERLALPTVAAVNGMCFGGGLELVLRCDVIIASESAEFAQPEQTVGFVPILGGLYRLAERVGPAKAMEWVLTSARVSAEEMARWGVVNRVVPSADLKSSATAFAEQLAQGPTRAVAANKTLLQAWSSGGVSAADAAMSDIAIPLWATDDAQDALRSAVEAFKAGQPRPQFAFRGR